MNEKYIPMSSYQKNNSSVMPSFNNNKQMNYKKMLKQEKEKQKYKDYMKQKRTQQIKNTIDNAKYTSYKTKQVTSNFKSKLKSLFKPKVGYEKQF